MADFDPREIRGRRDQVIHERGCEWLTALVVEQLFEQCAADALGDATRDLAIDHHRIDHAAAVFHHHIAA